MYTEEKVYISAMIDSLQKKKNIVSQLCVQTQEQQELLQSDQMAIEQFDAIMDQKAELIEQMQECDQGFDVLFQKIGPVLRDKKDEYQSQIKKMQQLIREITDFGLKIEQLEKSNRNLFEAYLLEQRKAIGQGRASNRSAITYYQNMPDQHRSWQTYFMDKKQ